MKLLSQLARLFTVRYVPNPDIKTFLERSQRQENDGLSVTVAVMSDHESKHFFGVSMARRGIQPIWIHCENKTDYTYRLDFFSVDPTYYTPLEAAYACHFSVGRRVVSFGLLAWLFLPLLPLLPFKLMSARSANRRMNALFKQKGFRFGPITSGKQRSGVVFTSLDEGTKNVKVRFITKEHCRDFSFSLQVPGLAFRSDLEPATAESQQEVDEVKLKNWIKGFTRCTSNLLGTNEGDPLNLVVVGDQITIRHCFGGRWDEAEAVNWKTCLKTGRAFLFDTEYRYSPVSSLYINGKMQDMALQKARSSINERIHLRLWRLPLSFEKQPVWIGQVSRDIGIRFTLRTWNLTTHKIDPDVDEARDYVADFLIDGRRVSRVGHIAGVDAATEDAPRYNLTGDPYFTDGDRAILVLSRNSVQADYLNWS